MSQIVNEKMGATVTIKDVLLGLSVRTALDRGRDYTLAMASHFDAKVTGVFYSLEPTVSLSMYPDFTSQLMQNHRSEEKKNAEVVRENFITAATKLGVSHEFQSVFGPLVAAISDFTKRVRVSDLTVLTQHHTGEIENVGNLLFETALFYSGRPLIVVPKDQFSDFSINRVLIAWDGSAHAARAVGAAMPLLEKAGQVAVLAIKEDGKSFDFGGRELVKNLCLHKMNAELSERHETDIAATVLKEAEMFRASLVVMGGYGHSRLREFVLGGVTRSMLKNMPTPVLMAH